MSNMDQVVYAPGPGEGQRFAVSTTGAATALNDNIACMGWVRVFAKGTNVDIAFGVDGDTGPVLNSTTQAEIGYTVMAGTYHDFWLRGTETHILWDAEGAGYLTLHRVGQERVRYGT